MQALKVISKDNYCYTFIYNNIKILANLNLDLNIEDIVYVSEDLFFDMDQSILTFKLTNKDTLNKEILIYDNNYYERVYG